MGAISDKISQPIQKGFYKAFYNWGSFVGKRPLLVIFGSLLLAILCSIRLLLAAKNPLPAVVEQDQLWVPQEAQAITDKNKYEAAFTTTYRRNTLYFTTKPQGGNILTSAFLKEVRRFDEMVTSGLLNATAYGNSGASRTSLDLDDPTISESGAAVTYEDVCAKSDTMSGRNMSDPDDTGPPACMVFGHPLELWYRVGGIFDFDMSDDEINSLVDSGRGIDKTLFPDSSPNRTVNVDAIFGGITRDERGRVTGAKALAFTYLLAQHPEGSRKDAAEAWEDQLNLVIGDQWSNDPPQSEGSVNPRGSAPPLAWDSSLVDIFPQTAGATSRELGKAIRGDLVALQVGFMIILAYAVFIFWKYDPIKSRALLAIAGCASVGLSIGVAYGFSTGVGLKLNPVINVLPFILIGIGVDDMFVLVAALQAEDAALEPSERMARAMGKAGVSITITSITDAVAFILGTTSQLPALSTFCGFAAIGICADFLLQISFFAGFMTLDARRERRRAVDCCPCCCKPVADKIGYGCCCCLCTHASTGTPAEGSFLKQLIVRYYIPCLRPMPVKALLLLLFAALSGVMAWSASNLKQDFQFRWFVASDATLQQAFDVQDKYFESSGLPVSTVTPPSAEFDYTSTASQQKMLALGAAIEGVKWIEADSLNAWYPVFREWVYDCGQTQTLSEGPFAAQPTTCVTMECTRPDSMCAGGACPNPLVFPHCTKAKHLRDARADRIEDQFGFPVPGADDAKYLVTADGARASWDVPIGDAYIPPERFLEWLDQFVTDSALGTALFASELVWVDNATVRDKAGVRRGLRNTRLRATYLATEKADEQIDSMVELRRAVNGAGVTGAFPYMFMYLYYEQYAIIEREALLNLGLALIAVFIIVTLFVANLSATILVMLCVVLVDVDILGLMWLWGLSIDSVAIINLVLAVGLAVDYSCHVAHAFCQMPNLLGPEASPLEQRQKRADKAVEEMGVPVIHGAVSTFLAVLVLSASKSYIFVIFFKQFFGICLFGSLHGLVLLPILLSLVGPDPVDVGAHQVGSDHAAAKGTEMSSAADKPGATPSASAVIDAGQISLPPSPPGSARVWPDEPCEA